jgi:hypothetical protein
MRPQDDRLAGRIVREWDAFRGNMCHGSGSAAAAVGEVQRAVTYVPHDPSFDTPDEGGITDHLRRVQSVRESSPTECNWPFLSRRSLLELQLRPRRCDLSARDGPDLRLSMSVNGLRHFETIGL